MKSIRQFLEPLFTRLLNALHTFLKKQNQIQIAIVLSEAGDLEGAKAILDKH